MPRIVNLYRKCYKCNKDFITNNVDIDLLHLWNKSRLPLQDIFPQMSPEDIETFYTGYCKECLKSLNK